MTTTYQTLKAAAEMLEKAASAVEQHEQAVAQYKQAADKAAEQVKTAQAKVDELTAASQIKTAADKAAAETEKAKRADLAKQAADRLVSTGLLTDKLRDKFAAAIVNDHNHAVENLAKLAGQIPATHRLGKVTVDHTPMHKSAEQVWAESVRQVNSKLG